jgi:hypothetical protein
MTNHASMRTGAVLLLLLWATAACNRQPSLAEDDPPPNRLDPNADFYGMVRRVHYNFIPFASEPEMRTASDIVVRGRIAKIAKGRVLGAPEGVRGGQHTFVMAFTVGVSLKGSVKPGENVYVEVNRSIPTSIESLQAQMPDHDMTLYLVDMARFPPHPNPSKRPKIFDEGAGLPNSTTKLFAINTPLGMVVETSQGLSQPLIERPMWNVASRRATP